MRAVNIDQFIDVHKQCIYGKKMCYRLIHAIYTVKDGKYLKYGEVSLLYQVSSQQNYTDSICMQRSLSKCSWIVNLHIDASFVDIGTLTVEI